MNKIKILLLLFCTVTLSGCWDQAEPERMHYIFGVGVDYKDGKYEVYAQVINLSYTAKSEEPVDETDQSEVGYARAETVDEAFVELYHSMGQKAFWGELSYIVLSEEVLKNEALNPVIDLFLRYRETRYQMKVYSTKSEIEEVLLATTITNKSISQSKLAEPISSFKQESFVKQIDVRTLLIGLNEPNHEVAIPYVAVTEKWKTASGDSKVVDFLGVGVVSPTKFKGFFLEDEIKGLPWMDEDTKRKSITTAMGEDGHKFTATINKVKVKVKPIISETSVAFDIHVKIKAGVGQLGHIDGKVTEKELREALKKEVKQDIKRTYKEGLSRDVDIYRLSEYVYRKNVKAWQRLQVHGKVPLSEDSIRNLTVEVKVDGGRRSLKRTIE